MKKENTTDNTILANEFEDFIEELVEGARAKGYSKEQIERNLERMFSHGSNSFAVHTFKNRGVNYIVVSHFADTSTIFERIGNVLCDTVTASSCFDCEDG